MRTTWAYTAGLIDGEGSLSLLKTWQRPSRHRSISVALTERGPLDFLVAEVGGRLRLQELPKPKTDMWEWSASYDEAKRVAIGVLPFLVIERRQQLALAFVERFVEGLPGDRSNRGQLNEALFAELRAVNRQRKTTLPVCLEAAPSEEDYAYLAGVLDGEGYVTAPTAQRHSVQISSTDPELPAWLLSRFGGSVYPERRRDEAPRRPCWSWRVHGAANMKIIAPATKYMHLDRKKSAMQSICGVSIEPKLLALLPGCVDEMAERADVPYTTVYKWVRAALNNGVIHRSREQRHKRSAGRPAWYYYTS